MTLSAQEKNLICIYLSGSREATAAQIREAIPYIDAQDVLAAAARALRKLENMSDEAFFAMMSQEAS